MLACCCRRQERPVGYPSLRRVGCHRPDHQLDSNLWLCVRTHKRSCGAIRCQNSSCRARPPHHHDKRHDQGIFSFCAWAAAHASQRERGGRTDISPWPLRQLFPLEDPSTACLLQLCRFGASRSPYCGGRGIAQSRAFVEARGKPLGQSAPRTSSALKLQIPSRAIKPRTPVKEGLFVYRKGVQSWLNDVTARRSDFR